VLELKIADDRGNEVATKELGELLFYGPTITPGYWNKPEADGRHRARRLAPHRRPRLPRREGYFFVVDRKKDMLIRGGENVYCTEIEHCLADHPEIVEAAVIGVPGCPSSASA
jgi:acyl-CoA synthetase (AMP-forming)/AMP-acid ligase II